MVERIDNETRSETMSLDEKPSPPAQRTSSVEVSVKKEEDRDDSESYGRMKVDGSDPNERVDVPSGPAKKSTKSSPAKKQQGRRQGNDGNQKKLQAHGGPPYPHHPQGMHGYPPSGPPYPPPPPPHYGYGPGPNRGPHDPYRGRHPPPHPPPPPHYHQMPHMPHPGQPGGPYSGPYPHHHPGMKGPPGPYHHAPAPYPGAHPPYPGSHPMPYHPGMHHPMQPYPPGSNQAGSSVTSDSASITSTKSRGSKSGKSTNSRKKRTIDGVHEDGHVSAFSFRRTHSSASTSSTVTAGNNTSGETPNLTSDNSLKGGELPPLLSRGEIENDQQIGQVRRHRRNHSGASTASSLSVGGFSLSSYEGRPGNVESIMRKDGGGNLAKASPKRRRGQDGGVAPARFQQLSMNDSETDQENNLFLSLSNTSTNHDAVDATPISKNTKKASSKNCDDGGNKNKASNRSSSAFESQRNATLQISSSMESVSPISKMIDQGATPPLPDAMNDSDLMTDEHLLNRHLRGQSFTPLPHTGSGGCDNREGLGSSPNPSFSAIAPQLSWDAPSLGDLADWEEQLGKSDEKRPGSAASMVSEGARGISPAAFMMWKGGDEAHSSGHRRKGSNTQFDYDNIRILSPNSDIMQEEGLTGTTTPLPIFFDHHSSASEERENMKHHQGGNNGKPDDKYRSEAREGGQSMFGSGGPNHKRSHWTPYAPSAQKNSNMSFPPTPLYTSSEYRDDVFGRSPHSVDRRDGPPADFFQYGMHQQHGQPHSGRSGDRVRNLRGRAPPGAPMLQAPPHLTPSHRHSLTSPMCVGSAKNVMWGHQANMQHHSPHHMQQIDLSATGGMSKRKCVPLKPPIPSKFQGDMEKSKAAPVPEFTSLVNFPAHMSQKQSASLPEGMRCCVMCGQACPCSQGNKSKKSAASSSNAGLKSHGEAVVPSRKASTSESMADKGFAIIPTQNKGLCTLCDVNVWIVVQSGLEIKWCKGCKNFRPWASFGDKGLATKCLRCRERQREKYALQKSEKERQRLVAKNSKGRAY